MGARVSIRELPGAVGDGRGHVDPDERANQLVQAWPVRRAGAGQQLDSNEDRREQWFACGNLATKEILGLSSAAEVIDEDRRVSERRHGPSRGASPIRGA